MRVLLSAYACEPTKGSEPAVGWNTARQAARFHDVWVITRVNNRPSIEAALQSTPIPNLHFEYVDLPHWAAWWKRGQRGVHIYYYLWQIAAYLRARRLHRSVNFALVHHVTFVNYWLPSLMGLLPIPFLWGPIGGGESIPRSLRAEFSMHGKIFEATRDLARWLETFDPLARLSPKRAAMVLATTAETQEALAQWGRRNVPIVTQVALPIEDLNQLGGIPPRSTGPFRVMGIAALSVHKGFHLGLRAFAQLHQAFPDAEYWILGRGPERARLEALAHELGIAESVRFLGIIPRSELLKTFAETDVLLHPVLHDSGGYASLEAMAAGRPVICLKTGGPAMQITEDTGFAITPDNIENVIRNMANALKLLAGNRDLRLRMGEAARRRATALFNWQSKGDFLQQTYLSMIDPEGRINGDRSDSNYRCETVTNVAGS